MWCIMNDDHKLKMRCRPNWTGKGYVTLTGEVPWYYQRDGAARSDAA